MPATASLDFGYPWWLSYGHLIVLALSAAGLFVGFKREWSKLPVILMGLLALWASAAFLVMRVAINVNSRASLPTQNFLRSGSGRVLDLGAGTGRSAIMVLEARPQATLVALDLFADSFDSHFGREGSPQQRLLSNLKSAGVEKRVAIETGDMRQLPFEAAAFDAVVSSYAVDHLNRDGVTRALGEAARVVKPGGEFLLMVVAKDKWAQFTFGPLLVHSGNRDLSWWTSRVREAGFQVLEEGTVPVTNFVLARRP